MTMRAEHEELPQRATEAYTAQNREAVDPCYADVLVVHGSRGKRQMGHGEHCEQLLDVFEGGPDDSSQGIQQR